VLAYYNKCERIDACSCSTDGGEINLWKLAGSGKPRFSNIDADFPANYKFSWNPCTSYTVWQSQGKCSNVAVCLEVKESYRTSYYGFGTQRTATCELNKNGECTLRYTGQGPRSRQSHLAVALTCDESREGTVDKVTIANYYSNIYKTVLRSKYACPRSSPTPPPPLTRTSSPYGSSSGNSSGLSLGSKLLITFFCVLIVYMIGGILLNKYARHIEGKEAFPNFSFWTDLPSLVKGGCVFTFHSLGRMCGKGSSGGGYASV